MFKPAGHIRGTRSPRGASFFTSAHKADDRANARATQPLAPKWVRLDQPSALVTGIFKYVSTRIGFKDRFKKAIKPMLEAATVGDMQRYFQKLPLVVELAHYHPDEANAILTRAAESPKAALYAHLTAVACGNEKALMPAIESIDHLKGNHSLVSHCIHRIAKFQPLAAQHLLKALMENDTLTASGRLAIFRELTMSRELADKTMIVGGFEMMMKRASTADRNDTIYPSLLSLLNKWKPHDDRLRVNHALTADMLRGWIASCQVISDKNHRMAQELLNIPPSARG